MNGAAEALLAELVDLQKNQAETLKAMANKMGASPQGGGNDAAGGTSALGVAAKTTGAALGVFSKAIGAAATILSGAFSTAVNLAGVSLTDLKASGRALVQGQMQLAQGAIEGTNSLHSMTQALEGLPGILGLAAKAMTYNTQKTEANIRAYQAMSETGANLGANLNEVRQAAAGMGLSMTEFGSLMKNSVTQLRYFGTTATDGAENLIKFNKQFVMGKEGLGKGLLGMGFTLEETNKLLVDYSSVMGGIKADALKDQRGMEQSVKAFAEELDASAQLEGKTRQQKLEEMKKENQNSAVQAKLSEMSDQQRLKYQQAMDRAKSQGEKDYIQSLLLGLPPMTKAGQQYAAMNAKGAEALTDSVAAIEANTSAAQEKDRIDKNGFASSNALAETYRTNKTAMNAMALGTGNMSDAAKAAAQASADQKNSGIDTEAKSQARMKKIYDQQATAQQSSIGATVQLQGAFKHFGGMMDALAKALEPLFPIITWIQTNLPIALEAIVDFGGKLLNEVIIPVFEDLFGGISMDDFLKPFKDFWAGLFGESEGLNFSSVRKGISEFFKPIVDFIGNAFNAINFEAVGTKIRETFGRVFKSLGAITDALGKAFEGGKGEGFGKFLGDVFSKLMDVLAKIGETISAVVVMFIKSPLFATLKKMFMTLVDIIGNLVDVVMDIVNSPIGKFLINALFDVFAFLGDIIDGILQAVNGVIQIVSGVFKILTGDFKGGWEKIKGGALSILKTLVDWFLAIPKLIGNILVDGLVGLGEALVGIVTSLVDGIKAIGSSIIDFFTSNKSQRNTAANAEAKPEKTPDAKAESKTETKKEAAPAGPEKTPAEKKAPSGAEVKPTPPSTANKEENPTLDPAVLKSKDPTEILSAEIQLLNKQTALLLSAVRENRDWSRTTAEKVGAFGNKFKG